MKSLKDIFCQDFCRMGSYGIYHHDAACALLIWVIGFIKEPKRTYIFRSYFKNLDAHIFFYDWL